MQTKKILVTGKNGSLSNSVAEWLRKKEGYAVEQISLRDNQWRQIFLGVYQSIVHIVGVTPQNTNKTESFYQINYELTKEFAKKAKNDGVSQFIYISSMAVYGIEQQMIIKDGTISRDTPCNPVTDYGNSKLLAEKSLVQIECEEFKVAIIRVPSIYGKDKTEYLDQYRYLSQKFCAIPYGFCRHYKSAIYIDHLCELIQLIIEHDEKGVFCPDDGKYAAVDFCTATNPNKRKSRMLGLIFELFLKGNLRVQDYYGAIFYDEQLSQVFEGKYRIYDLEEAVKLSYEK